MRKLAFASGSPSRRYNANARVTFLALAGFRDGVRVQLIRYDDTAFERRAIVKINHVFIDESDATFWKRPRGHGRIGTMNAIILVEVENAGTEHLGRLVTGLVPLRLFLPDNVIEPGQRRALGSNPDVVTQRGRVRPHHVEKGL